MKKLFLALSIVVVIAASGINQSPVNRDIDGLLTDVVWPSSLEEQNV